VRKSKILARIRAGQPAKIAFMGHFLPPFIAFAADTGYDGIWLDLEHRAMEQREVQALMAFFHLYDLDCMVRPSTREKARLYRYLEDGAAGLMIPHVSDAETVRKLVTSVKFPPLGDRGIEGKGLEANYGLDLPPSGNRNIFAEHANQETFLAVQLETPQAVASINEIAAVPGLDGVFIGPADLALRMQYEKDPLPYRSTLEKVAAAAKANGIAWGALPRSTDELAEFAALGAQYWVWGTDIQFLRVGLKQASSELDEILKS
jgi:2-keto-3-deoxy-L-rhamnonate aldolase RhmA